MVTIVGRTIIGTDVVYDYVGKSTDKKPISTNGSCFVEMDTGKEYFFDGDEQVIERKYSVNSLLIPQTKAENKEEAQALLNKAFQRIDTAAQKGVIKANTRDRYKTRLNKVVKEK